MFQTKTVPIISSIQPYFQTYLFIRAIGRAVFVLVNNFHVTLAYCFWMTVTYPLLWYCPALYLYVEGELFHWLLLTVACWLWSAGYTGKNLNLNLPSHIIVLHLPL